MTIHDEVDTAVLGSPTGTARSGRNYIRWVQQALNQILGLRLATDGMIGPQTRSAIRSFQQRQGLVTDGKVGPKTEAALKAATGGVAPTAIASARAITTKSVCATTGTPTEVLNRFAFDSDQLIPAHETQLIKVARAILARKSGPSPITSICVLGHTDPEGTDNYNLQLGQRRAERVAQRLRATLERIKPGMSAAITITADTRGEQKRVSREAALNRRVEIYLPATPPRPTPPATVPPDLATLISQVRLILGSLPLGRTGVKLPTSVRFLNAPEQSEAITVFDRSLDFTKILISDGLGFEERQFTVAVQLASGWYVVMNLGDLASWASPQGRSKTLIHELTHAWQSQHHGSEPRRFMLNSVGCQALALADIPPAKAAAAARATEIALASGVQNPFTLARIGRAAFAAEDVSAYAYIPGKAFTEYAAEQIAQQVEDAYASHSSTAPVLAVIQSVGANVRSLDNERSLTVVSFHRKSTPRVVFH